MKKQTISETIFQISRDASSFTSNMFTYGEVKAFLLRAKKGLLDDDILEISYDEGFNDGDSSLGANYTIRVTRKRLETDEEFEKRKEMFDKKSLKAVEQRYKEYLKLKKEFE